MRASLLLLLVACAGGPQQTPLAAPAPAPARSFVIADAPWRSAGSEAAGAEPAQSSPPVLIRGGRIITGKGEPIEPGFVLMEKGKIVAVGKGDRSPPAGATVIDAAGKHVTPGIIDTHSHLGVYPSPMVDAHNDGNEMTNPVTPGVRSLDAFWVQDPDIERAVAGGVTTIQVLPGSGNLIGGRAVTLKLRRATTARAMHFAGAPDGLKMACGENPKRVYKEKNQTPMTRMGNLALQRSAFIAARQLITEWDEWRAGEKLRLTLQATAQALVDAQREFRKAESEACAGGDRPSDECSAQLAGWTAAPLVDPPPTRPLLPPKRDVHLETLAAAIEGRVLVHVHCYRADDMSNMIALADEMGFEIRSFHHALEAYKIRKLLAAREISVSTWADWWGFKMEAYDGIPENLAMVWSAGARAIVHSDSAEGIRRLNQEAAKGMYSGREAGIEVTDAAAMEWLTVNPAWALGVDDKVGTLEAGKEADVVIWDKEPFSVYARAERVFIDGVERFDAASNAPPSSDFEASP